jgi:glycosyltransferase involved in cell wall biosynthesis
VTPGEPDVSVVLAAYERAGDLDVVLAAFADQRGAPAEIIVADDGSGDGVRDVVERWKGTIDVAHMWQPKDGFRKARALDRAALAVRGDYLVFLDADCVPRRGFLDAIREGARPGWFLSTKRLMLGEDFSRRVVRQKLPIWRWSAWTWFVRAPHEVGRPGYLLPLRDRRRPWRTDSPDFAPPYLAYSLMGVARSDFERVNGYDARCRRVDDGEDQDLAIRLRRSGLRCGWAGPASTVLHLWHPLRSYRVEDRVPVFRVTEQEDRIEAVEGLREIAAQVSANRVAASSSSSDPVKR